jgi:hypothetical protein
MARWNPTVWLVSDRSDWVERIPGGGPGAIPLRCDRGARLGWCEPGAAWPSAPDLLGPGAAGERLRRRHECLR